MNNYVVGTTRSALYKSPINSNKNVASEGSNTRKTEQIEYRQARVERLRELYEEHKPEIKKTWVLPKGETDGRKSIIIEEIIGKDISPFDLPDFNEQMPKSSDYIQKYME